MIRFTNSCDGRYNSSLDVRFTKACDNNCPFCIERNGIDGTLTDVDALIKGTLRSGKDTVLVLGGEPLLYPEKLLKYVKGIRGHVKKIYVTTSLPKQITDNYKCFEEIMGSIDCLNVSLQHYDSEMNNKCLCASSCHDRIEMLSKFVKDGFAEKMRVSINLVKGNIDSGKKLLSFLRKMESIGVKHVKINELQECPELYVSFEEICKVRMPSPYAHGCQKDIKIKGITLRITLKRTCFVVEPSRRRSFSDNIKMRIKKALHIEPNKRNSVLYENGRLSNGWRRKGI